MLAFSLSACALTLQAGLLSTLSPVSLPMLPVVMAAARTFPQRVLRLLAALALTDALSSASLVRSGTVLLLDPALCRLLAATLLGGLGLCLLRSKISPGLSQATPWLIGLLLGLAWPPSISPTLGIAMVLVSQGQSLLSLLLMMLVFGASAALPLWGLSAVSRLGLTAPAGPRWLGGTLLLLALLVLPGLDMTLKGWLLAQTPF
ncbi:hypothetical protein THUN1379_32120 [Paludibacterium sp. THUN1379]|uniref:hypothetical protein n=1 Tax=Paludibacterium sp. THUN1379 TaxID=3112107 RepID=UPI0030918D17|nr:hypothetical protein THUN1379_32120 [Paludibacterium sp. THUN1379]